MRSKSQSSQVKKVNFIARNKQLISSHSSKSLKTHTRALQTLSTNIIQTPVPPKPLPLKSTIAGFSFRLSFPQLPLLTINDPSTFPQNDYSLYPKSAYSDTDCPPTPPSYSLDIIFEEKSPPAKISEIGTQTEKKLLNASIEGSLRRSERLANRSSGLKRRLIDSGYKGKRIKYE